MLNFLSNLFGLNNKIDFASLIKNGAVIVDVRTKMEYKQGHLRNAINMPLDNLYNQLTKLKKDKAIITVCQSGMRSRSAKAILKGNGFEVYNGGSWLNLRRKIN